MKFVLLGMCCAFMPSQFLACHEPWAVSNVVGHKTSKLLWMWWLGCRPIIENFTESRMTLTAAMFEAPGSDEEV